MQEHLPQTLLFRIGAAALVLFGVYCHLASPDLTWFNDHMTRDLWRSMEWSHLHGADWLGPEMNYQAGRLFGPAFYWFVGALWKVGESIKAVLFLSHALSVLVSLCFCWLIFQEFGSEVGSVFFLLFFLMPVHVAVARTLWNPSMILPINLLMLILANRASRQLNAWVPMALLALVAMLGVQAHMSVLMLFSVSLIALGWEKRDWKLPLCCAAVVLSFILTVAYSGGYLDTLFQARRTTYGLGTLSSVWQHFPIRVHAFLFHVFLDIQPIGDYELFPLYVALAEKLFPVRFFLIKVFTSLSLLYHLVFVSSIFLCYYRVYRQKHYHFQIHFFDRIAFVAMPLVLVWACFFKAKNTIPYRYGLSFYPIQFMVIALGWRTFKERFKNLGQFSFLRGKDFAAVVFFSILIFTGYGFFLLTTYRVMEVSGRASHVATDAYSMPLRLKIALLDFGRKNAPGDRLFQYLHGKLVHRARNDEVWDDAGMQNHGVLNSLPLFQQNKPYPLSHYLVEDKNQIGSFDDSLEVPGTPFRAIKLHENQLPKNLRTWIFSGDWEVSNREEFAPGALILPLLRNAKNLQKLVDSHLNVPVNLRLAFDIQGHPEDTLNIIYDNSDSAQAFRFKEMKLDYRSVDPKLNAAEAAEPRRAILKLPAMDTEHHVSIDFEIRQDAPFSRVDIYTTRWEPNRI